MSNDSVTPDTQTGIGMSQFNAISVQRILNMGGGRRAKVNRDHRIYNLAQYTGPSDLRVKMAPEYEIGDWEVGSKGTQYSHSVQQCHLLSIIPIDYHLDANILVGVNIHYKPEPIPRSLITDPLLLSLSCTMRYTRSTGQAIIWTITDHSTSCLIQFCLTGMHQPTHIHLKLQQTINEHKQLYSIGCT